MDIKQRYYSTRDIQMILGISRTKANQIMHEFEREGKLFRHENTMRIKIDDFEDWFTQHTATPTTV